MAAAVDDYSNYATSPYSPCRHAASVSPSDSTDLGHVSRFVFVGGVGSGNLTVVMQDGSTVAFAGLLANTLLPIAVSRIKSTGTDVTGVVALW